MGGFGSGGRRAGAGRKRKASHLRAIDGGAGRRGRTRDTEDDNEAGADQAPALPPAPPAWLAPDERALWEALAPEAIAARTLTTSTAFAFGHLCQGIADMMELRARLKPARAAATGELLPLLFVDADEEQALRREHRMLWHEVAARCKDFCIAPFGKELAGLDGGGAKPDELDAWTRKRG